MCSFSENQRCVLFAVREGQRSSSRMTALLFAKGRAALREQQMDLTDVYAESSVTNEKKDSLFVG